MAKVTRLYEQIVPENYLLEVDLDWKRFTFSAHEILTFELVHASHELTLHAVELDMTKIDLDSDASVKVTGETHDDYNQTVTFLFKDEIKAGKHSLALDFTGTIEEDLHGLYRSTYEHDGQHKSLVVTDFEPVHARELLACVDEPSAKAVFQLKLTLPKELTALSNTNVTQEERVPGGRKKLTFAPTPKMSTYLLAFAVGEFDHVTGKSKEGVNVSVYGVPGQGNQLDFALDVGVRCLSLYTDYFGIPYPLPKLDMLAIPDFATGAMENWGLITYRDTALLLDPAKTSLSNKQRVAEVITHELAHQWFGNLVTMAWWNDLWLNEGFASWVEVLATDSLFPDWHFWTQFVAGDYAYALEANSLASAPALQQDIQDPRELETLIDPGLVYAKGSSIIRMLDAYLGRETFRKGLQLYLKRHSYGNTDTHDLWRALAEVSSKPVEAVMDAWTGQAGYPIVSFDEGHVKQQRFYSSPREATKVKGKSTWLIPFSIRLDDGSVTESALIEDETQALPEAVMASTWFKPNAGQTGLYRVGYTEGMVEALAKPLHDGKLDVIDRFGLVDDVFAGAEAGMIGSDVAMKLAESLREETDYTVWAAVTGGFGTVGAILEDETLRDLSDQFGKWLVQPNVKRLGWEAAANESSFDTLMRPLVLQQAVRFDDKAVTAEAMTKFHGYMLGQPIDPDLRPVALSAAARNGGKDEFDAIFASYRAETSPQIKMSLLGALSRFRKPDLIARSLEIALSSDVRPQDIYIPLAWSFRNRDARDQTWTWVQDNWDEFLRRYGNGGKMLDRFPAYAGMAFATHEKAREIRDFFTSHPHPSTKRTTEQAYESMELKADWRERDESKIRTYLSDWRDKRSHEK